MITRGLADLALGYQWQHIPAEVRSMAARCVLDGVACALAGAQEKPPQLIRDEIVEQAGKAEATLFVHGGRVPAAQAALANGTAAHALDYDDVNVSIPGHPTAVVMPAVFALAEALHANGRQALLAFIAGYEVACRVGLLVAPGHYDRGFHATATAGAIGAAAACAKLMDLDHKRTASAISLAATQAAGLKAMFANMGKPLHAGLAARNGVLSARLAARGMDCGDDALEHAQGFARALSSDCRGEAALAHPERFHILENLFKYHAACYGTHGAIECGRQLRAAHDLESGAIERVTVIANPASDTYCNIDSPGNSTEGKFSLRLNAAFGLLGIDTSRLDAYSDRSVLAPAAVALRDRIHVRFEQDLPMMKVSLVVEMRDGRKFDSSHDAGVPEKDFAVQAQRVEAKYFALARPVLGSDRASQLRDGLLGLENLAGMAEVLGFTTARRGASAGP